MVDQTHDRSTIAPPIAVVESIYRAVGENDPFAALAFISPAIRVSQSSALPFAGTWEGHSGFAAMSAAIYAAWPDFSVEPLAFLANGDTVLVITRVGGSKQSPSPLDQPMIERWRVVDGKAIECQPYYFDPVLAAASAQSGA